MSGEINDYLRNLQDKTKLNKLLSDEETEITLNFDLYSGEYKGSIIKFTKGDKKVELNTTDGKAIIYGDERTTENLDTINATALDYAILNTFNAYKLDEDYFDDLRESLELDLKEMYNKDSKKIEKSIKAALKDIHESDYDNKLIAEFIRKFDINQKGDHHNLVGDLSGTNFKYNTSKDKIVVKNLYNYKNKFSPSDVIDDFDSRKLIKAIESYHSRKVNNDRRLELEDGIDESYIGFGSTNIDSDFSELN